MIYIYVCVYLYVHVCHLLICNIYICIIYGLYYIILYYIIFLITLCYTFIWLYDHNLGIYPVFRHTQMMGIGLGWLGDSSEEMAKKALIGKFMENWCNLHLGDCWIPAGVCSWDHATTIQRYSIIMGNHDLRVCEIVGYRLPQWDSIKSGSLRLIRPHHG